ncbi:16042_t:CDS:2, partial [Acaulospora morrowiae]
VVAREQDNIVTKEQPTPCNTRPETMDGRNNYLTTKICDESDTRPYPDDSDPAEWLVQQGELVKLLSEILPTRKNLHKLYSEQYPDPYCSRCSLRIKDIQHVFKYPLAAENIKQIISNINIIFYPEDDHKMISHAWQLVELACGIIDNIFSTSNYSN